MIWDAFITWATNGLNSMFSGLPTCSGVGFDVSGLSSLSGYLGSVGLFVDLTALEALVAFVVAVEGGLRLWWIGTWVFHQFWGAD